MVGSPRKNDGFTLIELLVVVTILGVLASIAVPTYLSQREKAWRTQGVNDLKNAATAVESVASDNGGLFASVNGLTEDSPQLRAEGYRGGELVDLVVTADNAAYCIRGIHERLARAFLYRSSTGVVQEGAPGVLSC